MIEKIAVEGRIINPVDRERSAEIVRISVDTSSLLTWISAASLKEIGMTPQKTPVRFQTSDGRTLEREVGFAIIRVGERFTIDEVVFARPGDAEILGSRTLAGLNLVLDPTMRRLIAAGPCRRQSQHDRSRAQVRSPFALPLGDQLRITT